MDAVEKRFARMLAENPTRTNFQAHYEEIVAAYNGEKDRVTIEATFEALFKFTASLDPETLAPVPLDQFIHPNRRNLVDRDEHCLARLAGPGDPMPSINIDEETTIFTMDFAKTKGLWPQPAPTPRAQPATADRDPSISSDPLSPIGGAPGFNEGGSAGEFDKRPQGGAGGATIANAKVFTAEGVLKGAATSR